MTTETIKNEKSAQAAHQPEPTRSGWTFLPNVDIVELPDELLLMADVPGASAGNIDLNYERGILTVHARVALRQPQETRYILREYGVGDFYRRFEIGEGIDAAGIRAEITSGVLSLHLPKAAQMKPRKIDVQAR